MSTTGHVGEATVVERIVPQKEFLRKQVSVNNLVTGDALPSTYSAAGAWECTQVNIGRNVVTATGTVSSPMSIHDFKSQELFFDISTGATALTVTVPDVADFIAAGAKLGDRFHCTISVDIGGAASTVIFAASSGAGEIMCGIASDVAQPPGVVPGGVGCLTFDLWYTINNTTSASAIIVGGWATTA